VKLGIWPVLIWLGWTSIGWPQASGGPLRRTGPGEHPLQASPSTYAIQGATLGQETLLRTQIEIMQPQVLPRRIIFVPHWQFLYAAQMYRLRVPTGMTSKMFTHFASGSIYIDADRCGNDDWLGYWMAHELGHLATNSAKEEDAERAAHELRRHLKDERKRDSN